MISRTDLTGRLAVVTGGYSGIGLETARVLAEAGAAVNVPAPSPEKAQAGGARFGFISSEQEAVNV